MPSRELTYRVNIDVGTARQQARAIRQSIESELRNVSVATVNPRTAGTGNLSNVANAANKSLASLNKTLGIFGVVLGAHQLVQFAGRLADLSTEAARATKSFEVLSGSAGKAIGSVSAIQNAGQGAIDSLAAIKIGTIAASLGLAHTSNEFERLTRVARLIASASPVINDVGEALNQLSLFASNEKSFARADQLVLGAQEVRDRMKELRQENDLLTGSQAKLEASMQLVEEKLGATLNTIEAAATGYERLKVAITEARLAAAAGGIGAAIQGTAGFLANSVNELNVLFSGVDAQASVIQEALKSVTTAYQNQANILSNTPLFGDALKKDRLQVVGQLQEVQQIFALATGALGEDPSLIGYQQQIKDIVVEITRWGFATDGQLAALRRLYDELENQKLLNAPSIAVATEAEKAAAIATARAASIIEAQGAIDTSLESRAQKSADIVGIDQTIATLKEQKALVDSAITDLINSAITDPDEIALRLSQIESQATGFFDAIEERASSVQIDFGGIDTALGQFSGGFVDFLPGMDDMRDRLVDLQTELQFTSEITQEQADELAYLEAAAAAAGGEAVFLDGVVADLGTSFLATNEEASALIDAMYQSAAAYLAGQISAEQYAGITAALGGQLLALASEAGVATGAILQLISAQSGLSGTSGFTVGSNRGSAIAQRIATQNQERERRQQRQDAERAAKEAAREAERAAKRAGQELERGAKKAADELRGALNSVPGLFGASAVTQGQLDLAAGGVPQNFADDYVRRLKDEVFNGHDWQDVSIDEAKAALEKVGIEASDDAKLAFQQFADAWENSILFSDESNLDFINQGAVQLALDMQDKAKQGQENIYALFGVAIDDAVSAVGAGITAAGGSGSVETGYTIPIQAELIPANGNLTGIPTLGGISPVLDVAAIQGQLNTLALPAFTIDTSALVDQLTTDLAAQEAPSITVQANIDTAALATTLSQIGSQSLIIPISAALNDESFLSVFEKIQSTRATIAVNTALDIAAFAALFEKVQSTKVTITGSVGSFGVDVAALDDLDIIGTGAAIRVKSSIAKAISTTGFDNGQIVAPIATGLAAAINTQVRGSSDYFRNIGRTVSGLILAGTNFSTAVPDARASNPIANQLLGETTRQFNESINLFIAAGNVPAQSVLSGFQAGFVGTAPDARANTGIAYSLIGEVNRQFGETQNFFYSAGLVPAHSVLDGFQSAFSVSNPDGTTKSSLITGMLDSVTQGIRANSENFRQRGATIATDMQFGFANQFGNEDFKNSIIFAGELMAGYLKQGILRNLNGVADAISSKVMDDLSSELEAPIQ